MERFSICWAIFLMLEDSDGIKCFYIYIETTFMVVVCQTFNTFITAPVLFDKMIGIYKYS